MKRSLLSLIALFTLTAAVQAKPVITSVTPNSGPSDGGVEVVITGTELMTKVVCIVPCPTQVVFGDIAVPVKSETDTRLVVDAPAHQPGVVDLTLRIAAEDDVVAPKAFTFTKDYDDDYELVLLPIHIDGTVNGAFGSVWKSDFWINNHGTTSLMLAPWPCPPNLACPPVYPLTRPLAPRETLHNLDSYYKPANGNPSRVLYARGGPYSMSLRIADISRSVENAGADIPVIREGNMHSDAIQLFNVPMTSGYRVLLRLYETAYTSGAYTVRLYDQSQLTSNATPIHSFTLNVTTTEQHDFRREAAYAETDITALLQLERTWPSSVRIEIEPSRPGSRFWAFASITNNATQMFTLATPQ
jgi:hypothetical protein